MRSALRHLWITTVILAFCAGLLAGYVMVSGHLPSLRLPGLERSEPVSNPPKRVPPRDLPRLA